MCGESWLAIKDLKPTIPSSEGWASSVYFNLHLLLLPYFCMDLYFSVCMWFSKLFLLAVCVVYIHVCIQLCTYYFFLSFLKLFFPSLLLFFSLMLVRYTHILHVCLYMYVYSAYVGVIMTTMVPYTGLYIFIKILSMTQVDLYIYMYVHVLHFICLDCT